MVANKNIKLEVHQNHIEVHRLKDLELRTVSTNRGRFRETAVQKSKNLQTFLGIEPQSINLSMPNFDKTVGFYHSQPLSKFKVANSSRFKSYRQKTSKKRQKTSKKTPKKLLYLQ